MPSKRLSKVLYYLSVAEAVSKRSTCLNKNWGAVIVKDDTIIATGYNGSPRGLPNCIDTNSCYRLEHNIPRGTMYETCLTRDTMILRSNGRAESIHALLINQQQHSHLKNIYAMCPDTKEIHSVQGLVSETKSADHLYRIVLENDTVIRCTPEHRFLLEDRETYVPAELLKPLDRLAAVRWVHDTSLPDGGYMVPHTVSIAHVYEDYMQHFEKVYDITVPSYENFIVSIGDLRNPIGIVVHNCSSIHAEQNAIISASRADMMHADMYIYGFDVVKNKIVENPDSCVLCKRMIINSGIDHVIFANENGVCRHEHPTNEYGYRVVNVADWINECGIPATGY